MSRRARLYLVGSFILIALAGCSGGWFLQQREAWRHDAEVACLQSGEVKIGPAIAQLPAISGPGVCGADFPLKVAAVGESAALGYADELRPPAPIPQYMRPIASPGYGASPLPPDPAPDPQPAEPYRQTTPPRSRSSYPAAPPPAAPGAPLSIRPPGMDPGDEAYPVAPSYGGSAVTSTPLPPLGPPISTREGPYDPRGSPPGDPYTIPRPYEGPYRGQPGPGGQPLPPVGPAAPALAGGTAVVTPPATLACPMVSALDQWMAGSVQLAAQRWFGQPVVQIQQISAYSCRGMNGNPHAHISEHAFGNALDVAAFTLADGRKVTVSNGWRGLSEERGFLRDVHAAACQLFSTVLGPGSNVYHSDHLHLDLMRRSSGQSICNPPAIPGEFVAGIHREPLVTGSVGKGRAKAPALGFAPSQEGAAPGRSLPVAVAGED